MCHWEDCDQEGLWACPDGTLRCSYHAAVTSLIGLSPEEALKAWVESKVRPLFTPDQLRAMSDACVDKADKLEHMYSHDATHNSAVEMRNRAKILRELSRQILRLK